MLCKPTGAFDKETLAGASSGSPDDLFSGYQSITAADFAAVVVIGIETNDVKLVGLGRSS